MLKLLFPPTSLPFTYPWIIKRFIKGGTSILDLGCGDGEFVAHVAKKDPKIGVYGVDLFEPYIDKARKTNAYKKVYKKDVRKVKFPDKSYDVVLASQVVEHLKKKESFSLIKKMEKIASDKVVIGTPNGYFPRGEFENNKLQKHESYWYVKDFEKMGYKVYGQALRFIYGNNGLLDTSVGKIFPIRVLLFAVSYILSPLVYYLPQYSAHLIAVKDFK